MNRPTTAVLPLLLLTLITGARAEEADEATKLATRITTAGAALFDTKNAKAMAGTYTEDARLTIVTKDKDTGEIKTELYQGRGDIEAYYAEQFKDEKATRSKNTVEYARHVGPTVLLIAGSFQPENESSDLRLPFVQTRVRKGDKWLISSLQLYIIFPD